MSDARRDTTLDTILEENRPYYNYRLLGVAVEPILPKALDPGENVVAVFRGSMNRGWINYGLGLFTNITRVLVTDRRVIFMTFSLPGWKKIAIRYKDILNVDEKSHRPLLGGGPMSTSGPVLKELIIVGLGRTISHLHREWDDAHQSIASRIVRHQMELMRRKR